ncbi:hypothetical protein [Micromonospora humidisoli]|uniref:Fusaric acid resistance protein-like n=1 Tax=Micromonospora humidisoli TaxID=2807622 RepID=A0ABS2JIZ7_9ACTN|nr:hypothetical protein [Micromonospora humidisoli]MBM7085576.1 hypothetical protein [Micromonospora humidisoli]
MTIAGQVEDLPAVRSFIDERYQPTAWALVGESLEATRSRGRQPGQFLWAVTVCLLGAASPLLITPLLQAQINKVAFLAAWSLVLGTYLLATAVMPASAAFAATLTLVILFSSPGLISWEHNVLYNVQLSELTAAVGAGLLSAAVLAAALVRRPDTTTNAELVN